MESSSGDLDSSRNLEIVIAIAGGSDVEGANGNSINESSPNNKALQEDVASRMERGEACSSCSAEDAARKERICRVCHLSAKECGMSTDELVELGCGCKGELGFAHLQCAEAWFKVKGNKLCEICGESARNISGVGNSRFLEEWIERRWIDGSNEGRSRRRPCLQGQPLCNFLMGCLVIAFILPWFFRVNLF